MGDDRIKLVVEVSNEKLPLTPRSDLYGVRVFVTSGVYVGAARRYRRWEGRRCSGLEMTQMGQLLY